MKFKYVDLSCPNENYLAEQKLDVYTQTSLRNCSNSASKSLLESRKRSLSKFQLLITLTCANSTHLDKRNLKKNNIETDKSFLFHSGK